MSATSLGGEPEDVAQDEHGELAGGRTCSAVTKAREMDSVCSYRASGPGGAVAR